jgi:hypothetical protein
MACEHCNGTGKQTYRFLGDAMPRDLGNGLSVQDMGGQGTRACKCVRDLPATDGEATWWETESIYSEVVTVPIGCEAVEISADCEVPRGPDGRRYHRTPENAYYPPLIRLEMECAATLHADTAREIAAALIAAADACDARDAATYGEPEADDAA